jgi:hypothetical protein
VEGWETWPDGNARPPKGDVSLKAYPLNLDNKNKLDFVSSWRVLAQSSEPLSVDNIIHTYQIMSIDDGAPDVHISGGSRAIADTDGIAGESVSFTGTATDSDGTIATTQWLVDGSEVATGLTATIALPNGSTVVTFKATDNDSASSTTTATITVNAPIAPSVTISGGNRTISDTDGAAGESVSFTGTATDSDGTIATTQWLVGGSVVATGSTPSIALPNGSTVVTFKATDNSGLNTTTTADYYLRAFLCAHG